MGMAGAGRPWFRGSLLAARRRAVPCTGKTGAPRAVPDEGLEPRPAGGAGPLHVWPPPRPGACFMAGGSKGRRDLSPGKEASPGCRWGEESRGCLLLPRPGGLWEGARREGYEARPHSRYRLRPDATGRAAKTTQVSRLPAPGTGSPRSRLVGVGSP